MIIFPMAGLSQRFFAAGYKVPKYQLPLAEYSLFYWVLQGFQTFFNQQLIVFICQSQFHAEEFIHQHCQQLGINEYVIKVLTDNTRGQAETVYQGIKDLPTDSLTIFNIDSFHQHFQYPTEFDKNTIDGYLEVFHGQGEHWSFVESGENNQVLHTTEKQRISDLCSTGLYYFADSQQYQQIYQQYQALPNEQLMAGELYIAPMYNLLIQQGADIRYHLITADDIQFCGTPEEYRDLLQQI